MTDSFDKCFELLIQNEGGYSNNPHDPGLETMYGVTIKIARTWGYTGPMKDLPIETAKEIAKSLYWTPFGCDFFPLPIAFQVFDTAYNGGHPIQWLQEILQTSATGSGLGAALSTSNYWEIVARFNAKRLQYLASLKQPVFAEGRMNRISRNISVGGMLK